MSTYRRMVDSIAREQERTIAGLAMDAVRREDDDVAAADEVFSELLSDSAWDKVEAVDISDIAYDACIEARRLV